MLRAEILPYGRERVRFPWGRTAREGFLGLALWDFLRTDLTDTEARADLWRRWRVSCYEARGFLRPVSIAQASLARLLSEQRALQAATEVLLSRSRASRAGHEEALHRAWENIAAQNGIPPDRRVEWHRRAFKWLREAGILFEDVRPELAADRGIWLIRKGHTRDVRFALFEDWATWRLTHPGDFFWLCWWEIARAARLKKPARQCRDCGVLFIAGYGNERYCPNHRSAAVRKQAERRRAVL